jgi:hypothetical protein
MVPKASSPRAARSRAPGTWSSSQASFVPLKYGSSTRPVTRRTSRLVPRGAQLAQRLAVRRSCHTMARCTGAPVARSQSSVVSRWLVMPIAAMRAPDTPAAARAPAVASTTLCQISAGSCSTQARPGKCWANSWVLAARAFCHSNPSRARSCPWSPDRWRGGGRRSWGASVPRPVRGGKRGPPAVRDVLAVVSARAGRGSSGRTDGSLDPPDRRRAASHRPACRQLAGSAPEQHHPAPRQDRLEGALHHRAAGRPLRPARSGEPQRDVRQQRAGPGRSAAETRRRDRPRRDARPLRRRQRAPAPAGSPAGSAPAAARAAASRTLGPEAAERAARAGRSAVPLSAGPAPRRVALPPAYPQPPAPPGVVPVSARRSRAVEPQSYLAQGTRRSRRARSARRRPRFPALRAHRSSRAARGLRAPAPLHELSREIAIERDSASCSTRSSPASSSSSARIAA